eukprot:9139287-Pyramimonas_sp.AAC.1
MAKPLAHISELKGPKTPTQSWKPTGSGRRSPSGFRAFSPWTGKRTRPTPCFSSLDGGHLDILDRRGMPNCFFAPTVGWRVG